MTREAFISKAKTELFDVCIIGGGITGAGVLTDAVRRGWKAVLIEREDFASGTSSRSSKIIHGGLRYLKLLQFGLVRRALLDREHLLLRSRLVKPIAFIIPAYTSLDLMIKSVIIGFYDRLAGKSSLSRCRRLSAAEVLQYIPAIRSDGLKGGILYWEGRTNDAMLTISFIKEAADKTAVVLNYCEAGKFNTAVDEVKSVQCFDKLTGEEFTIKARVFVNATGVWLDDILQRLGGTAHPMLRPSKGAHIVVSNKQLPSETATIVPSAASDRRLLYCFPFEHGLTALGATDTDYNGSRDKIEVSEQEVDYLLSAFSKAFPSAYLNRRDVVCVYAGLRPMLDDNRNKGSYSRSREFRIWSSADNFINIGGGKLTSFLSMGQRCMEIVEKKLRAVGHQASRQENNPIQKDELARKDEAMSKILAEVTTLTDPVMTGLSVTDADIIYHVRHTFAVTLADVLTRRTSLTYAMKDFDEKAVRRVADIMGRELKRDDSWKAQQVSDFHEHWKQYHPEFLTNRSENG